MAAAMADTAMEDETAPEMNGEMQDETASTSSMPAAEENARDEQAAEESTARRFVAISLPKITVDQAWTSELSSLMCGGGEDIAFHNRRSPGGDAHFATITYENPAVAAKVAKMQHAPSFGGLVPVTALASSPEDVTEVEITNLELPPQELLRQFSQIGPIVSHRIPERKLTALLVYARQADAEKALAYNDKVFRHRTVSVRLLARDAPKTTKAVKAHLRPKRKTVIPPRLLFHLMSDDVKDEVSKLRKIKEAVMTNTNIVRTQTAKIEALPKDKQDTAKLGVLRSEQERLLKKRKKLNVALKKLCKPVKENAKKSRILGVG
eukprot:gene18236-28099_t